MRCLHFYLILFNLKVECWKLESSKLNAKVGCAICAICNLSNTNGVPSHIVSFLYLVWKCCMDRSIWCLHIWRKLHMIAICNTKMVQKETWLKNKSLVNSHITLLCSHISTKKRVYLYSLFGATFVLLNIFNTIYIHCDFVYSISIISVFFYKFVI
jgi:hypothetical protein